MTLRFNDCEVSLRRFEVRRGNHVVEIEPQGFDVLAYLLQHNDRVVTKSELLDEVWGNRFVSESALTSRIKSARRAVGGTGRDQRVIKTIHGRGYRFVADVMHEAEHDGRGAAEQPRGPDGDGPKWGRVLTAIARLADGPGAALQVTGGSGWGRASSWTRPPMPRTGERWR